MSTPSRVRLRAYKVGFGDCLLLTMTYRSKLPDGRTERHVLIDCGSVARADDGPRMAEVAELIAEHSGGQLDAVVATHRHRDHVGGFGDARAGETLDRLKPRLVIRPWTDVPESERDQLDDDQRHFLGILDQLPAQAERLGLFAFDSVAQAKRAARLAELGFKNAAAIARLEGWASDSKAHYVTAGETIDVEAELPGVKIQVLGPPTLKDVPALTRYAKESEEYWLGLAGDSALAELLQPSGTATPARARRTLAQPGGVGAAEWLLRNLDERRVSQGLEIVEALDDVLNNTSVILLVTIGSRRILLPGDAQAENWSRTLDQLKTNRRLATALGKVDLYKVGHHGSRNATPKRLTAHWAQSAHPVTSLLTTKRGVFEKSREGAVPKPELIDGLAALGPVHNTDDLPPDVWWLDLEAPTRGPANFAATPGPPVR
ncbi:MBL fold metallo-hydrolase [Kribbella sandramycini]|uniref:MBL fold metallo-hydrolase n=1 Tax=Kribbella sandramycini TaxID=60450 RepID=A0A7Y4KYS7_9ACTN|nr:MBL fold metallo-hydrolase [Kribbella sandramycini]MBB6569859.1 hypothetical protein [Kribbella sandramycini]NOL40316.1 MBL fold metallo-hydrolase [Kribbella sandramycini]